MKNSKMLLAQSLSLLSIVYVLYSLVGFLLPREPIPFAILISLVGYAIVTHVLMRLRVIDNFFDRLDRDEPCFFDALFLVVVPAALALICAVLTAVPFLLLLMGFLLICALHMQLARVFEQLFDLSALRFLREHMLTKFAFFSLLVCVLIIWPMLCSKRLRFDPQQLKASQQYSNVYAYFLAAEAYQQTGVLFAVEADRIKPGKLKGHLSDYPLGYSRLEESVNIDDVGYALLQAAAVRWGLPPTLQTNAAINRAVFVVSGIVLAVVVGVVFRSPAAFLAVLVTLLVAHGDFREYVYRYTDHHGAARALVPFGLAIVILLASVIIRKRFSIAVWCGLLCGLLGGAVALIRRSAGLPIVATCVIVAIIFAGRRRKVLAGTVILAVLFGHFATAASLKYLLWYRDRTMQITAPVRSYSIHGAAQVFLRGIGAFGSNAIDMKYDDAVVDRTIFNDNPLVTFTEDGREFERAAKGIFLRYIQQHPGEYVEGITTQTRVLFDQVLDESTGLFGNGLLVLLIVLVLALPMEAHCPRIVERTDNYAVGQAAVATTLAVTVFVALTAAVPIPIYARHFFHETVIALFVAVVIAIYGLYAAIVRSVCQRDHP